MIYAPDPYRDLKSGLMQILPAVGIQVKLTLQTMSTLVLALLFIMLVALSFGRVNCRQKLCYQLQKPSIF
jgi:hypothetical protein